MSIQFQAKLMHYHERILRWTGDFIAQKKDELSKYLASIDIPTHPSQLNALGEKASAASVADFQAQMGSFAKRGAAVKHGKVALMPVFSFDPTLQVTNDLRALLGNRELENEREILQYFKAAVVSADETVEQELKVHEKKLIGREGMKELQSLVASKCWQSFDERLTALSWVGSTEHYKSHKAQVRVESIESRMARFHSQNQQRVSTHFDGVLDRCKNSYKSRKANLAMPVSETDIEAEHKGLANSIREMLEEPSRDLADTDEYGRAVGSLNRELSEGYEYIRLKNVELWKVHSDDATRCALRRNQELERKCGMLCFFNKVPRVHKVTSQKHLFACFPNSGSAGAGRMSQAMQLKVFENWYGKDLARDAAGVWTNCYLMSGLLGLCGIVFFFACCGAPRYNSQVDYSFHPPGPQVHYGGGASPGWGGAR
jgi:hypothetical protein